MPTRIILSFALIGLFASNAIQSMENEIANNPHALHHACIDGDLEKAKLLIEVGADVNAQSKSGDTPLHKAAVFGHAEVAQLLIEAGADVNVKNPYGVTPLHRATQKGHAKVAQLLIEADADVNAKDAGDEAPFHWAAEEGHAEVAKVLIAAGADVNVKNTNGWTPLHIAAENSRAAIALLLIEAGADVDAKITQGKFQGSTPLHTVAWNGYAEFATILLSNKAQLPRVQGSPASFTKKDGALEILDLQSLIFLSIIEDLNNIDNKDREDHLNSLRSYPDFINILENPSENLADFCKHKHLEFLGNFVGMKTIKNETALDIAVKKKNQHLPLLLAAAGNSLNKKNAANVLGIEGKDLLKRLQEGVITDLEQKIDENIEEMLKFKVLKQEMALEDEPKLS